MTVQEWGAFLSALAGGGLLALPLALLRMSSPPATLLRTNFRGRTVPAVLGDAIVISGLTILGSFALLRAAGWDSGPGARVVISVLILLVGFGAAGAWDDRKGDERPRGFKGHLGALAKRQVTGGLVKLMVGAVAGLAAGSVMLDGIAGPLQVGLIAALAANLANLFDRAPGRAGKVCLLCTLPLVIWGHSGWSLAAAGPLGALLAVMPFDLRERAMLGDAGANPLGAVVGIGAALSLGESGRWVLVIVLLVLNAASERWSFSAWIESSRVLSRIDRAGRTT